MGQRQSISKRLQREQRREEEYKILLTIQRVENFIFISIYGW